MARPSLVMMDPCRRCGGTGRNDLVKYPRASPRCAFCRGSGKRIADLGRTHVPCMELLDYPPRRPGRRRTGRSSWRFT